MLIVDIMVFHYILPRIILPTFCVCQTGNLSTKSNSNYKLNNRPQFNLMFYSRTNETYNAHSHVHVRTHALAYTRNSA